MKVKEMIKVLQSRDPEMEVVLARLPDDEDAEEGAFVAHSIAVFEMAFPRPSGLDAEGNITTEEGILLALCSSDEFGTFHTDGGEDDGP